MKKHLLVIATIAAALLVILLSALAYLTVDESPPNVADLAPVRANLSAGENAFSLLEQAGQKFVEPDRYYHFIRALDGEQPEDGKVISWDSQEVKDVLAGNAEALRLADEGLARGKLEVPEVKTFNAQVPYSHHWSDLGYLMEARTYSLCAQGRHREALDEALKVVRFGHMVQLAGGTTPIHRTGLRIKRDSGYPAFAKSLCGAEVDADTLAGYSRGIAPLIDTGEALANTLRTTFLLAVNPTDGFGRNRLPNIGLDPPGFWRNFLYLPNATRRILADDCRTSIRNIARKPADYEISERDSILGSGRSHRPPLRNLGGVLWTAWIGGCDAPFFIKERIDDIARNRGIRLLIALKLHQMKYGAIPPSLDDLVPEFIDAVPADPFDGKPFRYIPSKKIIYSIDDHSYGLKDYRDRPGKGEDDGGDEFDDIVIKIEF